VKRLIAITALSGMMLVPAATTAMAQEASPPTTSELDENLPGDAPDVLEDNGDDDSNAGLWGLLGLLGLVGLAGLTALKKRRDDTYSTSTTTTTRPAPPTSRGATGTDK
jgi:LPXTG-motif cell wall-anchored protein